MKTQEQQLMVRENVEKKERKSKKAHYVNVLSQQGVDQHAAVLLPGRHSCECEASTHDLVNNCLKCGRIVCRQEGSGACMFCGENVEDRKSRCFGGTTKSKEETQKLFGCEKAYDSIDGNKLSSLGAIGEDLQRALYSRNSLLNFDANSEKGTKVIDDQTDYYSLDNDPFLTVIQRNQISKRKEELREARLLKKSGRAIKVNLNLENRTFVEEKDEDVDLWTDPIIQEILKTADVKTEVDLDKALKRADLKQRPEFLQSLSKVSSRLSNAHISTGRNMGRVQSAQYADMTDSPMCISLNQPYASLLVKAIKKHEGRNWYTEHRGSLWIASTSKQVEQRKIEEIERFYLTLYNDNLPAKFPRRYKFGVMLGRVDVVDCIPQEQYRARFPEGEIEDAFVMICENHKELAVNFAVTGKPKIFKLDKNDHSAAVKRLLS